MAAVAAVAGGPAAHSAPPAGKAAAAVPAPVTPPPATAPAGAAVDPKVKTLLDYLEKDAYGKKLATPFWVSRAMGVISMARLPRASATAKLLDVCERDKHDVVRLLAWQAVLARAADLDAKERTRWLSATLALADKDAFAGSLRVALLDVLAAAPPTARAKRAWEKLYAEASAWEPQDMPTLDALGRSASVWRSLPLVERLIKDLVDPNACVRAEYVLHAAGCDTLLARSTLKPTVFESLNPDRQHPGATELWAKAQGNAAAWLTKHRGEWKEPTAVAGEPWKLLQPLYVAAPVPLDQVDPQDPLWTADLELGRADVGQIEVVFVVDATGSMGEVLDWLRRDVARVSQAFALLSKEAPNLGVVFYRDVDAPFREGFYKDAAAPVVRLLPLTYKVKDLLPKLGETTAEGGGDIPEAVLDGLTAAVDGMKWSKAKAGVSASPGGKPAGTAQPAGTGKMLVLIGDAPPKPGTEPRCEETARRAAAAGIKVYACKVTTADGRNDLTSFDGIAKAGGGSTVDASFTRLTDFRVIGPNGRPMATQTINRPEAQLVVASGSAEQPPGERILAHLLSDLINPEYKDRVDPLARTLLAHVQPKSEPEKRLPFPANTPPLPQTTYDAQKR
jgi:hypothetical protein